MKEDDIPVFPVAKINSGPVPSLGIVTLKFDFLTSPMQSIDHPNEGRHYALTPDQAKYVAQQLTKAVEKLETISPPAPPNKRN